MKIEDAYKLAWREAKRRRDFDEAILLRRLDEVTDRPVYDKEAEGEETAWEHLQRLVLGLWRDRVPPGRFKRRLRRSVYKEIFGFLREAWRELASLRTPRWMRSPRGITVYGIVEPDEDEKYYDEWQLPWQVALQDDWNSDLLARAVAACPKDEDDDEPCHDIPVWLVASSTSPLLDVMIGKERLVGANSDRVWDFLRKIADEDYHAIEGELSVWDPEDNSSHELEVDLPRAELPEDYVKSMSSDDAD